MTTINSSAPRQYLADEASFRDALAKLSSASSLSVNSESNLVPSNFFSDLFSGSMINNRRLVELKIMEFLVQGKKWLKPEDISLIDELASKVGLFMKKPDNSNRHKELRTLINLIVKEMLQHKHVSSKDYSKVLQDFQNHYRRILSPYSEQCEQVKRSFDEALRTQNENGTRIFDKLVGVTQVKPEPKPAPVAPKANVTHPYADKIGITTKAALASLASLGLGTAAWYLSKQEQPNETMHQAGQGIAQSVEVLTEDSSSWLPYGLGTIAVGSLIGLGIAYKKGITLDDVKTQISDGYTNLASKAVNLKDQAVNLKDQVVGGAKQRWENGPQKVYENIKKWATKTGGSSGGDTSGGAKSEDPLIDPNATPPNSSLSPVNSKQLTKEQDGLWNKFIVFGIETYNHYSGRNESTFGEKIGEIYKNLIQVFEGKKFNGNKEDIYKITKLIAEAARYAYENKIVMKDPDKKIIESALYVFEKAIQKNYEDTCIVQIKKQAQFHEKILEYKNQNLIDALRILRDASRILVEREHNHQEVTSLNNEIKNLEKDPKAQYTKGDLLNKKLLGGEGFGIFFAMSNLNEENMTTTDICQAVWKEKTFLEALSENVTFTNIKNLLIGAETLFTKKCKIFADEAKYIAKVLELCGKAIKEELQEIKNTVGKTDSAKFLTQTHVGEEIFANQFKKVQGAKIDNVNNNSSIDNDGASNSLPGGSTNPGKTYDVHKKLTNGSRV